jgi:hypothetical protein
MWEQLPSGRVRHRFEWLVLLAALALIPVIVISARSPNGQRGRCLSTRAREDEPDEDARADEAASKPPGELEARRPLGHRASMAERSHCTAAPVTLGPVGGSGSRRHLDRGEDHLGDVSGTRNGR